MLVFASCWAQTFATAEFGVLLPVAVAHPPFSINWLCCHVALLWNSMSFVDASACPINRSTQIGVRTAATAAPARSVAALSAVLPRTHPHQEKPTIIIPTAPTTTPQNAGFSHCGTRMRHLLKMETNHLFRTN